ncbi:MAG: porin family protein [Bacteroidia bacterium]|nr:porin family protein [Bacteroidia bacterium]NNJ55104.1 outer membrane beta-barrel protein [Bacteroidia bacterium]
MKKSTFIITVVGVFAWQSQLQAQSNYFSLQTGYAAGIAQETNRNSSSSSLDFSNEKRENVYYSFGEGIQVKLAYGHMFTDVFGVELGVSQLLGTEHESSGEYSWGKYISKQKANLTTINPSIVYLFSSNKVSPYAKFGLSGTLGTIKDSYEYESGSYKNLMESETTSKFNWGITSALGASLKLNDNLSLLGEASFMSSTFNPKKLITTKYEIDGEDQLSEMTTREKETVFVDKVTTDNDEEPNDNQPEEYPSFKLPMSNLAFTFGIKYSF